MSAMFRFLLLSVLLLGPPVAVAEVEPEVDTKWIDSLVTGKTYSGVVIAPDKLDDNAPRHIMLPPHTKRVVVVPKENTFEKESESFRQFRWHYAAYWSLFMTMLIMDAAWAE